MAFSLLVSFSQNLLGLKLFLACLDDVGGILLDGLKVFLVLWEISAGEKSFKIKVF